jgi:serine O-acetyltransferase
MFTTWKEDIRTIFKEDPAARSTVEVILCYPGLHALWLYRMSHLLWQHRLFLPARLLSHLTCFLTRIEIHPGAKIGRRFFIDHGTGVVIGETAEIGDDVLMYQGVVLGGTSLKKEKRHPTIGNRVVIGGGAVVLGAITVGDDARIGSGSVVIKAVPQGATVVGVPGKIVVDHLAPGPALDHSRLPDPVNETLKLLLEQQNEIKERLYRLEKRTNISQSKNEILVR